MSWLTKELTLDILSITIGAMVNIHDAIEATTKKPETSPHEIGEGDPAQKPEDHPTPEPPTPATAADDEPAVTFPQIQTALRTIAQAEGTDWIQKELFPALDISNLTQLTADNYPAAWERITDHQSAAQATKAAS